LSKFKNYVRIAAAMASLKGLLWAICLALCAVSQVVAIDDKVRPVSRNEIRDHAATFQSPSTSTPWRDSSSPLTAFNTRDIHPLTDTALRHPQVAGMLRKFRDSKTGYITLNSKDFNALIDGPSRPYSVYVFGDSTQYGSSKVLQLSKRLKVVGDVAKSFLKANSGEDSADKFIVVRILLEDSKSTFQRIGAVGLPHLSFIPPTMEIKPGKDFQLTGRNLMQPGPVEDWRAEEIANFIAATSGMEVGDLSQLNPRSPFLPLVVLFFLGGITFAGYKFANSSLIHYMPLYICGSLMVYWFSVSGGMFNIIRNMPFVGHDRRTNQAMVFMPGNGQVGAEGFIMGTSVMAFGMLIAHFVFLVPRIEDPLQRRKVCYGILAAAVILFRWITGTHVWKLGLRSSFYF
jgi:oligosaccharyltransferase complex subunit gamma